MSGARAPRYATYWVPEPGHPLWTAGCTWLGRDPRDGGAPGGPARAHVASPWRYGFHATLKAPVRLAPGVREDDWIGAVRALASRHAPFAMPPLRIAALGGFLALRPVVAPAPDHPLHRLADDCVRALDPMRAPPDEAELARRHAHGLDARGRSNVERWGYPWVLEDWRMHLTLSEGLGGLDPAVVDTLRRDAELHFEHALARPAVVSAISVCVEPAPGAPFELRCRMPLGGGA
ncbi:MAG: DUF1045 domain-containing protein [Burkholderiaceae bacterium]|jgi:hypothetical protein|nr:DUF1045 domain-containing protein [Burkholderiales bacterium]MCZ8101874.1 DUF1045 domain-containing protein [Burkholderiales bacterium]MCZ8338821.1 DUF1045 domain-containing protein [Burkholderiaceae bacterium]